MNLSRMQLIPERAGGWLGEGDEQGLICRANGQRTSADIPKEQLSFKGTALGGTRNI